MLWHIYLTRQCNLQCTYCGNDPRFESIPSEPHYGTDELIKFLQNDKNPIINFYGGEPLLRINKMIEIINQGLNDIQNVLFVLQTNGVNLDKIPPIYIRQFHSILVSVDGRKEITNHYRGNTVHDKVFSNISTLKNQINFTGELIARMTVSHNSDIFQEVIYLLDDHTNPGFTHVHWQLDVLWSSESWPNLEEWILQSYNPGIRQLIRWWVDQINENGKVYGIIPFMGIITTLLTNVPSSLRCGAGLSSYTISTDSNVIFCPICPEEPESQVGSLENYSDLKTVKIGEPCISCSEFQTCGGRCLYTNFFRYSTEKDYDTVCQATKYLISELTMMVPEIKKAISENKITFSQLKYPEINNGCEIIP